MADPEETDADGGRMQSELSKVDEEESGEEEDGKEEEMKTEEEFSFPDTSIPLTHLLPSR